MSKKEKLSPGLDEDILTTADDKKIDAELKGLKKINKNASPELTTRLKHMITSVNGDSSDMAVNGFVQTMLARDSLHFRTEIQKIQCDIELKQSVEIGGEVVEVEIPLTTEFFWPAT